MSWQKSLIKAPEPPPELSAAEKHEKLLSDIFAETSKTCLDLWVDAITTKKINSDLLDHHGYTALHIAVWLNLVESVKILLDQADFSVDVTSENGKTPLMLASANESLEIIKILLDKGADLEKKDALGFTPLLCAVDSGKIRSFYVLKARGADLQVKNYGGYGLVHLAASKNRVNMMRVLKKTGFDLESKGNHSETPLHVAAVGNCLDMIEYLLFEGVSTQVLDKDKKSPIDVAEDYKVEGPGMMISQYKKIKYPWFSYFFIGYWGALGFLYYFYVLPLSMRYLFTSLLFNLSFVTVLPVFL